MGKIINLARGGMPDFKGWFCDGQSAEFNPPYDAPHAPFTPPFDSHADAAMGQGYLNLQFPLVPNLNDTVGHRWMQNLLRDVKSVGDVFLTNWIPQRSYLDSIYYEVTMTDKNLVGVYLKPVAKRCVWNFDSEEWEFKDIDEFTTLLDGVGITEFPIGTPADGDSLYGMARLLGMECPCTSMPCTFGHNIMKRDDTGKPIAGYDEYFGTVMLGFEVTKGDAGKIANMWKSTFALYTSAKMLAFEGSTQIG